MIPEDAFTVADTRHRARRQRRADPRQRAGPDHRLSHHRGRIAVADAALRPPRCRAMLLAYDQETGFRPGPSPRPDGPAGRSRSAIRARASIGERVAVCWRRGPASLGGGAHRRQAGIRRVLGICFGRGDVYRPFSPQFGRHRSHRPGRRPDRHRLAPARAGPERAAAAASTWSSPSTC